MDDRDDLLNSFMGQKPKKVFYLHDHASLVCLAFLLFLIPRDEDKIEEEANDLCYKDEYEEGYTKTLLESLKADKEAYKCYTKALEALEAGQIEEYIPDPKPSPYPPPQREPRAYAISFLMWAEKAGYSIPTFILDDIKPKVASYISSKRWRTEEKNNFPTLTHEDLMHLSKEPLWYLHKAVLYALGYNSTRKLEDIAKFYQYNDMAKQLFVYIDDAQKAGSLKLVHSPVTEDGTRNLFTAQVGPTHFIEWAKTMPLYLPGLHLNEKPTKPTKAEEALLPRERNTLLRMIIGMAVEQYGYDPKAKKNAATQNIVSDLELHGLEIDAKTVLKWLKEASELLPQDKGKSE